MLREVKKAIKAIIPDDMECAENGGILDLNDRILLAQWGVHGDSIKFTNVIDKTSEVFTSPKAAAAHAFEFAHWIMARRCIP